MAKLQSAIFGDPKLQFSVEISTLEEGATEGERERESQERWGLGTVDGRDGEGFAACANEFYSQRADLGGEFFNFHLNFGKRHHCVASLPTPGSS
jgi:hypothetical protein